MDKRSRPGRTLIPMSNNDRATLVTSLDPSYSKKKMDCNAGDAVEPVVVVIAPWT